MYKGEYTDFKFGDNWASDFNLVVVSDGDRYTPPMYGNINSNTSTVAGKRGVYKWKTQIAEKTFTVNLAFDKLAPSDVPKIKKWLNPNKIQKLFFNDEPNKFYYACLNSEPNFSFLPFWTEKTEQIIELHKVEDNTGEGSKDEEDNTEIPNNPIPDTPTGDNTNADDVVTEDTTPGENEQVPTERYEYVVVGETTTMQWVYKGEMTLEFIAIDNVAYSDYGNFESVEITKNLKYEESDYTGIRLPWIQSSNLLNNDNYQDACKIYTKSFIDLDTGEELENGLSFDSKHRFYLLNSGNTEANLNLTFDLVIPNEQPLVIYTQKVQKVNGDGWIKIGLVSAIVIESFKDYIPFIEYIGEENYKILTSTETTEEIIEQQKSILNQYVIEIDSDLREIYIKEKSDENNVLNINKFNGNREFLKLCECNFVDYSKEFPTLSSGDGNIIEPTKIVYTGTAIENTFFNEIFVGETDAPYRLTNVHFDWKHTYN